MYLQVETLLKDCYNLAVTSIIYETFQHQANHGSERTEEKTNNS